MTELQKLNELEKYLIERLELTRELYQDSKLTNDKTGEVVYYSIINEIKNTIDHVRKYTNVPWNI